MSHAAAASLCFTALAALLLLGSGCGRGALERLEATGEARGSNWPLKEPEPEQRRSPLVGEWLGPEQIGNCIETGSWRVFDQDGSFEQVEFNADACYPEQRGVTRCSGSWRQELLEPRYEQSGELLYACSVPPAQRHARSPSERYERATFALWEDEAGVVESMSLVAWRWHADGLMRRAAEVEVTYPPSSPGAQEERFSSNQIVEILLSDRRDGAVIQDAQMLLERLGDRASLEVEIALEVSASVQVSGFGEERGEERFVLPGALTLQGDDVEQEGVVLRAHLGDEQGALAWSAYLQDQGINARYAILGAVFSLSFVPELYLDLSAPLAWTSRSTTRWYGVPSVCEALGARVEAACASSE